MSINEAVERYFRLSLNACVKNSFILHNLYNRPEHVYAWKQTTGV